MFSVKFQELEPFVTVAGNEAMKNIQATNAYDDVSLLATLRALLFERLNGEEFRAFVTLSWPITTGKTCSQVLRDLFGGRLNNVITFVNAVDDKQFKAAHDFMSAENLKKATDHSLVYQQSLSKDASAKSGYNVLIYNDEDKNMALIIVQNMDIRAQRAMSVLIRRFCPKLFQEKSFSQDEVAMLSALTQKSPSAYKDALLKVAEKMDLRERFLKVLIGDFERRETERLVKNAENAVRRVANEIEAAMNSYADAIRRHKREVATLEGYKLSLTNQNENSELFEYVKNCKHIDIIKIEGSTVCLNVRTFCDIFDQSIWNKYAARGNIFQDYHDVLPCFKDTENIKILCNAIFNENPVIRLKICGHYYFDLNGVVYSRHNHNYGTAYKDYIPNPHLQYHACLGENRTQISEQLTAGNIIGALECITASCKSLNMSEISQTLRPMIRDMLKSTNKIISTPEGDMTPEEALNWLKAKEKK